MLFIEHTAYLLIHYSVIAYAFAECPRNLSSARRTWLRVSAGKTLPAS